MKKKILSLAFATLLTIGLATPSAEATPCVPYRIYCNGALRSFGYVCAPTVEQMIDDVWEMAVALCN